MDVEVQTVDGLKCPCGRQPLLHAEMRDQDAAGGRSTRILCPHCGAGSLTGAALLEWFAAHPVLGEGDVDEFSALLRRWLEDITPAAVNTADLEAARTAWQDHRQ